MSFHIGKLINDQLKKVGMTKSEFARRVASSPQSIHYILKRKSIDTDMLQKISRTLNYDFFQHFLGLDKPSKANDELLGFTTNDIKKELESVKSEIEIVLLHNAYLKEILQLIKPSTLPGAEKRNNPNPKNNSPKVKTNPKTKRQKTKTTSNKNSPKKIR